MIIITIVINIDSIVANNEMLIIAGNKVAVRPPTTRKCFSENWFQELQSFIALLTLTDKQTYVIKSWVMMAV